MFEGSQGTSAAGVRVSTAPVAAQSAGIAVLGMACRYADVRSPAELWETVMAQRQAFRRIPSQRLRLEDYLAEDRSLPDGIYATRAAVLEGYRFDRVRYRVSSGTYKAADPAHWLALDTAARALADAGFEGGQGLDRDGVGVLLGNTLTGEFSRAEVMRLRWPYVRRVMASALAEEGRSEQEQEEFLNRLEANYKSPFTAPGDETLAGGLANTIAGRICNYFDFHGGGYTVDGACASSLLALSQACSALLAGDLDVALAGGVDLSIDPFELVGFSRVGALAAGAMRVYDAGSAGFIPGEGCGVVVLMREDLARARGLQPRAVIHGWGVSSDGAGGISRPELDGQRLALKRAYRRAGYGMDSVAYFEGHGTGTAVGDHTELQALGLSRRAADPEAQPAALGSVKANLGHTKAAAGVAGLIKTVELLRRGILPPHSGFERPHPEISNDAGRPEPSLRLLRRPEPWPRHQPRRAGVSAMGFGGINVHLTLEASEQRCSVPKGKLSRLAHTPQDAELMLLDGDSADQLLRRVQRLRQLSGGLSQAELADLAAELERSLRGASLRAAVVASHPAELATRLEQLEGLLSELEKGQLQLPCLRLEAGLFLARPVASPRLAFAFPGQGSPANLDGGLWRRRFAHAEALYDGQAWTEQHPDRAVATEVAQPAIATASLLGLQVLAELGIQASVAVGHSLGELSALAWAGCLQPEDLPLLAAARGQAMAEAGDEDGAMAALSTDLATVESLLDALFGNGAEVVVACHNAPQRTVISGPREAVQRALAQARDQGLEGDLLRVSHAFHSPLVAAAAEGLGAALEELELSPPEQRVISTISGELLDQNSDLGSLLQDQLTHPVRFLQAVNTASAEVDLWLEVGPGRALGALMGEIGGPPVLSLDVSGPSLVGLLRAVGAVYALGGEVETRALFADRFTRPFDVDRDPEFLINPCERAPEVAAQGPTARVSYPASVAGQVGALAASDLAGMRSAATAPATDQGLPGMGDSSQESALAVVRQLVAAKTELPEESVGEEHHLLGDLHLSSIVVGQLAAEASRRLGLEPPASPTDYANVTVGAMAQSLDERRSTLEAIPEVKETTREEVPAGVEEWVRAFTIEARPEELGDVEPVGQGSQQGWSVELLAPEQHPLASAIEALQGSPSDARLLVLALPAEQEATSVLGLLTEAARRASRARPQRFLLVQHLPQSQSGTPRGPLAGGGGGFARTLHLETSIPTSVLSLPSTATEGIHSWIAAELQAHEEQGLAYAEAIYDADGCRYVPRLRALVPDASATVETGALGSGDVLLVSGGGKGIGAECALDLVRGSGARLGVLGRSDPERDPELAENLRRFQEAGIQVRYARADLGDDAAVAQAVAEIEQDLGAVTALLHGAGVNHPRLLAELQEEDYLRTLAPKVRGLRHLLSALNEEGLRLVVSFGSVIARTGMAGEADYALANEWLALEMDALRRRRPECRCLHLDWSVWSGVGMGERLGRLEALAAEGITAITPDGGVAILRQILARTEVPPFLVVTGRFGQAPTLAVEAAELPLLRFLETPRVYLPGVELVVDAEISGDSDPYLGDHVYQGQPLLPAVLGMEAMAQTAVALAGRDPASPGTLRFESVRLERPVVVAPGERVTVRVAGLLRDNRTVDLELRSSSSGLQAACFRARCVFEAESTATTTTPALLEELGERVNGRLAVSPDTELYGGLLFQAGRFQRLSGYRLLQAKQCLAEISADGHAVWFGGYLAPRLLLGDPGARDAALHAIQACVPHSTVLPVGVERLELGYLDPQKPWRAVARERKHEGDLYVYDLELLDEEGEVGERWQGLELRAVDLRPEPEAWSPVLLATSVERRLEELMPSCGVAVALETASTGATSDAREQQNGHETLDQRRARGDAALARLLGRAKVHRRPDGKPEAWLPHEPDRPADGEGDQVGVSLAHAGSLLLAVSAPGVAGCDLEAAAGREPGEWSDLLGAERLQLAQQLASELGEDLDSAATRVWTALESLKKAGVGHGAPLSLGSLRGDGWVLMHSGEHTVVTYKARVRGQAHPLVLAVRTGTEGPLPALAMHPGVAAAGA